MSRARVFIGPLVVAVAVWCAAGRVTIAAPDSADLRFIVPAPWWIALVAFGLALVMPAWRRDPKLALPAVLATVPWWPIPLPAVALIWTGPLAWLPIAASACAAIGAAPIAAVWRRLRFDDPKRAPWAAALLTLGVGIVVAWLAAPRIPGTDEPHYLLITQSLLEDGDLKVENNRLRHDYDAYYAGELSHSDSIVRGTNGEIYSIHAPGLPVLVLPAFALFGYRGAQATVLLLAAITGALVWRIGWRATGDTRAAWCAWAAVAGSVTSLMQSVTIFPDGPGAVAVAASILLMLRLSDEDAPVPMGALVGVSALLAALPWLHTRFAVLSGGFGLVIAWLILIDPVRSYAARLRRLAGFLVLPLVATAAWLTFFRVIYGTFNPAAPYGDTSGPGGTHLQNIPGAFVAVLFDGQFGLLAYTPVLAAAGLAWWHGAGSRVRRVGGLSLAIALTYVAAAMTYWMWWAGNPAPPARFVAVVLPALALAIAVLWARADGARRAMLSTLLTVSIAISAVVIAVNRAGLTWNDRDGQAQWLLWLGPVANLRRAWPSFFWTLDINNAGPDHLSSEWAFVGHAALWVAVWSLSWAVGRRVIVRRALGPAARRLAVAVWLTGGLMIAADAGWWLNRSTGLDAARTDAAVMIDARQGRAIFETGAHGLHRVRSLAGRLTMATEEPGRLVDPPSTWFTLSTAPAGDYDVWVSMRRPAAGTLHVQMGSATMEVPVFAVANARFRLHVPADVPLSLAPDAALSAAGGRITMTVGS